MAKSASTRSTCIPANMPIASWPLVAGTTRYPFVDSMKLMTESSCSLSSTQSITFFGRMVWGTTPSSSSLQRSPRQHVASPALTAGLPVVLSGPSTAMEPALSSRILVTPVCLAQLRASLAGAAIAQKDNRQAIRARPVFLRSQKPRLWYSVCCQSNKQFNQLLSCCYEWQAYECRKSMGRENVRRRNC